MSYNKTVNDFHQLYNIRYDNDVRLDLDQHA
jgi:hypothetical protein